MRRLLAFLLPAIFLIAFLPALLSLTPAMAGRLLSLKTGGSWDIGSLRLSWMGPQVLGSSQFANDALKAQFDRLEIDVPLWGLMRSPPRGSFILENGSVLFPPSSTMSHVEASVRLQPDHTYAVSIAGSTELLQVPGSFGVSGTLTSLQPLQLNLQAAAKRLPGAAIDLLADALGYPSRGLAEALLGDRVDFEGGLYVQEPKGSVDLSVVASRSALEFHGDLDGQSISLRGPLIAWFPMDSSVSRSLLKDVNPLFLSAVSSKQPVRIEIRPTGASLPYHPFSWKTLQISEGTLDLGQVVCQNNGALSALLSMNKQRLPASAQEMNIWFTPLYFSIKDGVVTTQRMDALVADTLHICSWGVIDIPADRLRMTLGLTSDALESVFGIRGLPPSYVLKLPLKGTLRHPHLETSGALTRIAAMSAAKKIKGADFFGGKLGSLAHPDTDTPAPTTQPYPWERPR